MDLNSKTSRGTEKAQKNTWTVDMESYVFLKYEAVRNTVSSSKSQANATQSAIDGEDV